MTLIDSPTVFRKDARMVEMVPSHLVLEESLIMIKTPIYFKDMVGYWKISSDNVLS